MGAPRWEGVTRRRFYGSAGERSIRRIAGLRPNLRSLPQEACPMPHSSLSSQPLRCAEWGLGGGRTQLAENGKSPREERLVKALRDNLRRRKASHGDAAVTAGKPNARPVPKRPAKGNDLS